MDREANVHTHLKVLRSTVILVLLSSMYFKQTGLKMSVDVGENLSVFLFDTVKSSQSGGRKGEGGGVRGPDQPRRHRLRPVKEEQEEGEEERQGDVCHRDRRRF